MAAAAEKEEEVEELSIIKQKKQRKRKNNTRMNEYNSNKVSTVDMYNAYVGIKNPNSGKNQNLGDGKESEDAKKKVFGHTNLGNRGRVQGDVGEETKRDEVDEGDETERIRVFERIRVTREEEFMGRADGRRERTRVSDFM